MLLQEEAASSGWSRQQAEAAPLGCSTTSVALFAATHSHLRLQGLALPEAAVCSMCAMSCCMRSIWDRFGIWGPDM